MKHSCRSLLTYFEMPTIKLRKTESSLIAISLLLLCSSVSTVLLGLTWWYILSICSLGRSSSSILKLSDLKENWRSPAKWEQAFNLNLHLDYKNNKGLALAFNLYSLIIKMLLQQILMLTDIFTVPVEKKNTTPAKSFPVRKGCILPESQEKRSSVISAFTSEAVQANELVTGSDSWLQRSRLC